MVGEHVNVALPGRALGCHLGWRLVWKMLWSSLAPQKKWVVGEHANVALPERASRGYPSGLVTVGVRPPVLEIREREMPEFEWPSLSNKRSL